jgi:4-hydroxyphenylacetate 3-monooxygenase/4-hydroxybutyryl-CoA dehydratase/vinylacetyl-CoA-Delta-isomerase
MKTAADYKKKIFSLRKNIYIDGQLVGREDSRLEPGLNTISLTYDAFTDADPQIKNLVTAQSHLNGHLINRFTHIHQGVDDLIRKQLMTRLLCHRTGTCILRCMGIDAMNALYVATDEVDQKKGTDYHQRFRKYLRYFQENDLAACCAQTDVKGNRKLRPHEQADPDLYLRIVEKRSDGIIVNGAKAHITMAAIAEEIIVVPTRVMTKEEQDWAVAFAIPSDTEGIKLVTLGKYPPKRKKLHAPFPTFGSSDSMVIFNHVFVPNDRIFMCGEWEFAGRLALLFALYHRHSYTGCKPAVTDIIMGMAALLSEYMDIENASHVRRVLVDLISIAELVFAAGLAGAYCAHQTSSGAWEPNIIYCNVGRRHAGTNIYAEYEKLCEIAGGLCATLPLEGDFYHEDIKDLLNKYIMRRKDISAENQHRLYRFVSDYIVSAQSASKLISGVHGGGSPIMEEIALYRNYDIEEKKRIAKKLAGIPT